MPQLKRNFVFLVLFFALQTQAQRSEFLLEKNWKFSKGDFNDAMKPGFNDAAWQPVTVPHDWAIYGPFDKQNDIQLVQVIENGEKVPSEKTGRTGALPYMGIGWYRTQFSIPDFKAGKQVVLLFDGAMSYATVYINGTEVGTWPYGYNSFHYDITKYIQPGQPVNLAVRLNNKPESSRWYPGAGLYRNVHVIVKDDNNIDTWGSYITTPVVNAQEALVNIKTKINTQTKGSVKIQTEIKDAAGKTVASNSTDVFFEQTAQQQFTVSNPKLWTAETPALYTATTTLLVNGQPTDVYSTRFGIRDIKFEAQKGFLVNGVVTKFKGVCNHHDLGPLGAAVNYAALKRQLVILKDMGCNAIRTSHNPPTPELLDLCDEMGFYVMDEAFDEWLAPKMKNGYHLYFNEWADKDLTNLIHRDRNHPSIVLWSIGNEIYEQSQPEGNKVAAYLQNICHREDPSRLVTAGMNHFDKAVASGFAALLDVPGFNYATYRYPEAYTKMPQGFILGSETVSTVSSRGVYQFPAMLYKHKVHPDAQSSSYDLEACNWSQRPDEEFAMQDSLPYMMGEFVWTGFDYLGEPTPNDALWPSRSSYFGIVDLAGIPKDRYYLYRSKWNTTENTLHILPHWNWKGKEGDTIPVYCYTNYPSAELFVNGKSQGKRFKTKENYQTRYRLMWNDVLYEPGTIKVVAYDAAGKAVATKEVSTTGKAAKLELAADRSTIKADGKDLSFITIKMTDAKGQLISDAANQLSFKVSGAGRFRAVCNGDATSLELFHLPTMKLFNGMLVLVVEAGEKAGKINVEVTTPGFKKGVIEINAE